MTTTELTVLRTLPGPNGAGYSEGTIMRKAFLDGVSERAAFAALKALSAHRMIELVPDNRNRYRQTAGGAARVERETAVVA